MTTRSIGPVKSFQLREMRTAVSELHADIEHHTRACADERPAYPDLTLSSVETLEVFIDWLLGEHDPHPGTIIGDLAKRLA